MVVKDVFKNLFHVMLANVLLFLKNGMFYEFSTSSNK